MASAASNVDVRSEILRCATRLLARRGFDGTSLQAIADEVGVRKPSVLYHFPSKEAVRQGVLDQLFDHWGQTLPRLMQAVASGDGRFDALIFEMLDFFRADPDRARLLVREAMDRPQEMRDRLAGTLKSWVTLVADYIRTGQQAGGLRRDVDPESYVVHIILLTVCGIASSDIVSTVITAPGEHPPPPKNTPKDAQESAQTHVQKHAQKHVQRHVQKHVNERHTRELLRIARTSLFEPRKKK